MKTSMSPSQILKKLNFFRNSEFKQIYLHWGLNSQLGPEVFHDNHSDNQYYRSRYRGDPQPLRAANNPDINVIWMEKSVLS